MEELRYDNQHFASRGSHPKRPNGYTSSLIALGVKPAASGGGDQPMHLWKDSLRPILHVGSPSCAHLCHTCLCPSAFCFDEC